MKEPFGVWIWSGDGGLAGNWERVFKSQDWPVFRIRGIEEILSGPARIKMGFLLMDPSAFHEDTLTLIRRLRAEAAQISIILILREGGLSRAQMVQCLEQGVDDLVPAAIDERVLQAKLKAHLRRLLPSVASGGEILQSSQGHLKADRVRHEAWSRNPRGEWRRLIHLTPKEFSLLCFFLEHPGAALDRRYILESLWGERAEDVNLETLDRHVESLRRKLGAHGRTIRTLYGVGYAFKENNN